MRWPRGGCCAGARARPVEPRARHLAAVAGRRGARVRPPAGRRPPRRQAGQRPARRGRQRVPLRLRDRRPPLTLGDAGRSVTATAAYVAPEEAAAAVVTRSRTSTASDCRRSSCSPVSGRRRTGRSRRFALSGRSCRPRSTRSAARLRPTPTSATSRSIGSSPRSSRSLPGGRGGRDLHARGEPVQGPAGIRRDGRRRFLRPGGARRYSCRRSATARRGVVGPSGIGKSSVVKAGLVPALRSGRCRDGTVARHRHVPRLVSLRGVAAALLRVAVERPEDLVEELARDELGIRRVVKRILRPASELLVSTSSRSCSR